MEDIMSAIEKAIQKYKSPQASSEAVNSPEEAAASTKGMSLKEVLMKSMNKRGNNMCLKVGDKEFNTPEEIAERIAQSPELLSLLKEKLI